MAAPNPIRERLVQSIHRLASKEGLREGDIVTALKRSFTAPQVWEHLDYLLSLGQIYRDTHGQLRSARK